MYKSALLFAGMCVGLLAFPGLTKADSIDVFDVNAIFAAGITLDTTLVVDTSTGTVSPFQGNLLVPPIDTPPLIIPTLTDVPVTGVGGVDACGGPFTGACVSFGGSADGFSFISGPIVLSCSGFAGFRGGALPPVGCSPGFIHINDLNGPTPHEVGGAALVGGSVVLAPEPTTLLLLGTGMLGLMGLRLKARHQS